MSLERGLSPGADGRDLLSAVEQALTLTGRPPELSSLLRYVLDKISEMVDMVWAAAWVFREDEDAWVVAASLGLTPAAAGIRFRSQLFYIRVPVYGDVYMILKFLALVFPQAGKLPEAPAEATASRSL